MPAQWWRKLGGTRQDFLDKMANVDDDVSIACGIIENWGFENGIYNRAAAPVEFMIKYLDYRLGALANPRVSLRDLKHILYNDSGITPVADWIRSNYPF